MDPAAHHLVTGLLKAVSRSFYLTMRVLPPAVRPQISVAYLLARTTDTIADTEIVPMEDRIEALQLLRDRVLGASTTPLHFGPLAGRQKSTAEKVLLERVEETLAIFGKFSYSDQQRTRDVLKTIASGQELDLKRFAGAGPKKVIALRTDEELDDYTYRVAGCVGEFWTRICRAHLFPNKAVDEQFLIQNGVRFGKGLQLVNILRDLPRDLRQGRCYLPSEKLAARGLTASDLLLPKTEEAFRPVYDPYLDKARDHLAAGWAYTNALPRQCVRVRLACAWPVLIGVQTLAKLRTKRVLDPAERSQSNAPFGAGLSISQPLERVVPETHRCRSKLVDSCPNFQY
jgi:farnesyl-diphosphate farnesyltransferase